MSQNSLKVSFVGVVSYFAAREAQVFNGGINCSKEVTDRVAAAHDKLLASDPGYGDEYEQLKANSIKYTQALRRQHDASQQSERLGSIFARARLSVVAHEFQRNLDRLQAIYEGIKDKEGLSADFR